MTLAASPASAPYDSVVCLELDDLADARSFSRSPVLALERIGRHGYAAGASRRFVAGRPSGAEMALKLEQLRLLEYGEDMRVVVVPTSTPSVDIPEDLRWVPKILKPVGMTP